MLLDALCKILPTIFAAIRIMFRTFVLSQVSCFRFYIIISLWIGRKWESMLWFGTLLNYFCCKMEI